jgi:archaellum component FlaG (FlaF/FlaG flagellin family)
LELGSLDLELTSSAGCGLTKTSQKNILLKVFLPMFSLNKTVVCLEFSKTTVFCALAQISGRKVDIIAIDTIHIESGILEEGIIYDIPHLEQIVKNLITSVSKTHNKIDAAWIAVPDNKVLITKFDILKDKKGISEENLHKTIEEKFNFSASKLLLINRPIHELNNRVFYLSNAIRIEHLEPFFQLFDSLDIPVESVFPTFHCIYEDLKSHFTAPSLLLYPNEKGFKFFLADENGVHLESVWGHNVIEFNENFDKAIDEIVQYAKQSKEVALGIKQILVVESPHYDSEAVQTYLQKTRINFNWISIPQDENNFNPINVVVLKGLLKAAMTQDFNKGFLEDQIAHEFERTKPIPTMIKTMSLSQESEDSDYNPSYTTPMTRNTVTRSEENMENRWNRKVIIASVLLAAGILGLLTYAGTKLSARISKKTTGEVSDVTPVPTANNTPEPTATPEATPTPVTSPTPTTPSVAPLEKKDVKVLVLNGNNKTGEAGKINTIIKNAGFTTEAPGNNPTKNVPSTTVTYKDPRAEALAQEVAKLIEPSYPSAKAVLDANATKDILVVLGAN